CRPQRICPQRSLRTSRLCFRRQCQNQSTHENGVVLELTQQHRELIGIIDYADRSLDRGRGLLARTQPIEPNGETARVSSREDDGNQGVLQTMSLTTCLITREPRSGHRPTMPKRQNYQHSNKTGHSHPGPSHLWSLRLLEGFPPKFQKPVE